MQVRSARDGHRRRVHASLAIAAAISAALAISACGHTPGKPVTDAGKRCGTSRTAADVPVTVEIDRGYASCGTALTVEKDYAQAIDQGKAPGNGGGGPVPVDGWVCQGFPTPQVLKTGDASKCTKGSNEILATLNT